MIPYATQTIDERDIAAVTEVLTSGWLTQGPAVPRFEQAFAEVHQVKHALAVCNATAGLHLACLALGVGPGDVVWTSPISFVASANCVRYCGAEVDFVDIDILTRNMSVAALSAKLMQAGQSGKLPKVVIPVHYAGLPCDMLAMRSLADEYGFSLLADASHAVGAQDQGVPVGSAWADISVFSFHPVKIITTGEGGMVVTQNDELAQSMALLRSHGITRDASQMTQVPEGDWYYEQRSLGFNYRMTDLQAALGFSQLGRLQEFHLRREHLAARYPELLAGLPLALPPKPAQHMRSSWHLYAVQLHCGQSAEFRAQVFANLREQGIGVNVHYIPIHMQPYYRELGFREGDYPQAEAFYRGALSLPLYPTLSDTQQDSVALALRSAVKQSLQPTLMA